MQNRFSLTILGVLLLGCVSILFACTRAESPSHPQPDWSQFRGALVQATMKSKVGVLLDDVPVSQRERLVHALLGKPKSFWIDRAKRQIRLTSMHLTFRNAKGQLPLPPEEVWEIAIENAPLREMIEGHDVVTVDYVFSGILLTDEASPGFSEPTLGEIGGTRDELFVFPIDPEFVFQRTGFSCINESQFPPKSFDAEEVDLFYSHHCRVGTKLSNTTCHQTAMPALDCIDALNAHIGKVEAAMHFERLPWVPAVAESVRIGEITNLHGPDLDPHRQNFLNHRFTYRYIPQNSCTLVEKCVGAPGWRHLLMFPTGDVNVGTKPLEIGVVDYFHEMNGALLAKHGVFELSLCHNHYHFSQYGSFKLGEGSDALTHKNGFCLQPSGRPFNNELSPLHHPYRDCINQGVSVGWIDEYKMGLECQWIDISDVRGGQDLPLSFTSNPEGFLCEGAPKRDSEGNPLFEPTLFKTTTGEPVDRPLCDYYPGWSANNTDSYTVHVPEEGESYVTDACREGLFGELRNCGFLNTKKLTECQPGKKVTISCSAPAKAKAQVIRVCEGSRALTIGIPCTYNDALASAVIDSPKDISFTCPSARDDVEVGGVYSFMTGSFFPEEEKSEVTCVTKNQ